MEHTNLFLFEDESAMAVEYPDGKVENPIPGVAYARDDDRDDPLVYFNDKITNYSVTITPQDRSGVTIDESYVVTSPQVLEGNTVKVRIPPYPIDGYKEINNGAKIEISGSVEYASIYLVETSYTITVNHVFSGESIASATTIIVEDVFEDDVVSVLIEPLEIEGYVASSVTIEVSGDTTYDLEYVEVVCADYTFVDLGLDSGTLWATTNVGANNPWEAGNYYAWGEVEPKSVYSLSTYKWYDSVNDTFTKYTGSTDKPFTLVDEDDAAHVTACDLNTYMPYYYEILELVGSCTITRETLNGVVVAKFEGSNGNSIVFPMITYMSGGSLSEDGFSRYWGCDGLNGSGSCIGFCDAGTYIPANFETGPVFFGYLIRPVIHGSGGGVIPQSPVSPIVGSVMPQSFMGSNNTKSGAVRKNVFKRFANVPAEDDNVGKSGEEK